MNRPVRALSRISMSLPEDLLVSLDRLVTRRGFPSRSHAIAVMLSRHIVESKATAGDEPTVGTITLLYDNDYQVQRQLGELQHKFGGEIISSSHIRLSDGRTLQVLFVQGAACRLRAIVEEMVAVRAVSYAKSQLLPVHSLGADESSAPCAVQERGTRPGVETPQALQA